MTDNSSTPPPFAIAIHGGAGTILAEKMTVELETAYHAALKLSLQTGHDILEAGGSALDAVQKAVNVMEDSPLFNAGKGAVFSHDGINEQDACIMDGATLATGAVAAVRRIRNPIDLARLVMEQTSHVLLAAEGAEEFARLQGMELVNADYFFTERRWQQLQAALRKEKASDTDFSMLDHSDDKVGTVGAVALDRQGNLAAATSTGGMTNKRYMRIGDTPVVGAGTYASNATCAVSATGQGEHIIRMVAAYDVAALMEYRGMTLEEAANHVIHEKLKAVGGDAGLIAIDRTGTIVMPFNTPGMYRGHHMPGQEPVTAVFR
jgi:beta-aspartyl-peptidase (threonine type)